MSQPYGQIRFLIEQYYDIQKLRVEAFNRIVAYVKSQKTVENQTQHASHREVETHGEDASHITTENHWAGASQTDTETHYIHASQEETENHYKRANHFKSEAQFKNASVKPSTIAHQIVQAKIEVPKQIADLVWYHNSLRETERQLAKRLDGWSSHHPLRINFLSRTYGIGPIFSSGLIAWLSPISRFSNISKLWKYCGLAPGQKRKRGQKLNYNPHLKTLMWKIASSFEKQKAEKSRYRRIYQEKKKEYLNRADLKQPIEKGVKGAKLHVRLMAMRYASKRFLADLWLFWRRMEGLPVTEPYATTVLGHSGFEEPEVDKPRRSV